MSARGLPIIALLLSGSVLPFLTGSGCTTEAYCFICDDSVNPDGSLGTGGRGTGGLDFGGGPGRGGSGGGLVIPDAGGDTGPGCTADIQNDPNNCGACGNRCNLLGAFAKCERGQCLVDRCTEGFRDLNSIPSDGCEYKCPVFPSRDELCNGEDDNCDGVKDEGFDLTTLEDCGSCGNKCQIQQGVAKCALISGFYQCAVERCVDRYRDIDGVASNGCEYECPVWPPVTETCNALDDDCDGVVNNGNPGGGQPCQETCPLGVCRGECKPGETFCIGSQLSCVGGEGPRAELCDGKDNDCDGANDNGFAFATDPKNCGACGRQCSTAHAVSKCASSLCVIENCEPGFRDLNSNPDDGCEHTCEQYPPSDEICDNVDNDCDNQKDEGLTAPPSFCRQTGPCSGSIAQCLGAQGWRCNYAQVNSNIQVLSDGTLSPAESFCDDFDNNCDGNVDEPFPNKGTSCSAGIGICRNTAVYRCTTDRLGIECPAVANPGAAVNELCNALDDNCDGQADERNPISGTNCGGSPCLGVVDPMVDLGNGVWMYQYEASHPDATLSDTGSNITRACAKPGVMPWASANQAEAATACADVHDSNGDPMRLCDETDWEEACNAGQAGTRWSYSQSSSSYAALICNDANAGRTGPWETGHNNGQSAQCRAAVGAGIYDLSGNVAEWTRTTVTTGGNTYYRVRGGSYQSLGPATACNFSFVLQRGTYANYDLGFRCCSDSPP